MAERTGNGTAHTFGDLVTTACTAASAVYLRNSYVEYDRINSFDNCGRSICAAINITYFPISAEALAARAEDMNVTLAAEENDALVDHHDTVKFTAVASAYAALEDKLDVISYGNAVKSARKINGVDRYVRAYDLSAANSYYRGMINNVLTVFGEPYSLIFVAILISARIENTLCIYADRFSLSERAAAQAFIF